MKTIRLEKQDSEDSGNRREPKAKLERVRSED